MAEVSASGSLRRDVVFNTVGIALRAAVLPLVLAWIARALGPALQGRFGFAHAAAIAGGSITIWGIASATSRYVAHGRGAGDARAVLGAIRQTRRWLVFSFASVATVALAVLAALRPEGGEVWLVVPYAVVVAAVHRSDALAAGFRRYDVLLAGQITLYAGMGLALPAALGSAAPVEWVVAAWAASRAAQALVVQLGLRPEMRALREQAGDGPALAPEGLLSFAVQMAGVTLLGTVVWESSEVWFLRTAVSPAELGLFTAVLGLTLLGHRVPALLAVVLEPYIAQLHGGGADDDQLGDAWRRATLLLSAALIPGVLVGIVLAEWFVRFLLGPEYTAGVPYMRWLLVPLLGSGLGAASSRALAATGGQSTLLALSASAAAANLLLDATLIPSHGLFGASIAAAAAAGLHAMLLGGAAYHRFGGRRSSPRGGEAAEAEEEAAGGVNTPRA